VQIWEKPLGLIFKTFMGKGPYNLIRNWGFKEGNKQFNNFQNFQIYMGKVGKIWETPLTPE